VFSKWNFRYETLKRLEEIIGKTLENVVTDNTFLNRIPVAEGIRARIDKWDCIKFKCSVQQRKKLSESRDSLQNGRKFASHLSNKALIPRIKLFKSLTSKEHKIQLINGQVD
jgi:hypothetical protein